MLILVDQGQLKLLYSSKYFPPPKHSVSLMITQKKNKLRPSPWNRHPVANFKSPTASFPGPVLPVSEFVRTASGHRGCETFGTLIRATGTSASSLWDGPVPKGHELLYLVTCLAMQYVDFFRKFRMKLVQIWKLVLAQMLTRVGIEVTEVAASLWSHQTGRLLFSFHRSSLNYVNSDPAKGLLCVLCT